MMMMMMTGRGIEQNLLAPSYCELFSSSFRVCHTFRRMYYLGLVHIIVV